MQTIFLSDLIQFEKQPTSSSAFVITSDKSTCTQVDAYRDDEPQNIVFWACPTPLCGDNSHQYNPCYIMAVLSITPLSQNLKILNQIQLPKVLFTTHPDIRRSMTLNAMRMATELFGIGSERIYQLAQQRLEADQPDVVHDLLVYLMHAILGARREYSQERFLRAESIAAYLGVDPQKVLLLMRDHTNNESALVQSLERGDAGRMKRHLDLPALVKNQIDLLAPFQHSTNQKQVQVLEMIRKILDIWKHC